MSFNYFNPPFDLLIKSLAFSVIYCLITDSSISSLIFILFLITFSVIPIKYFLNKNIDKYLAIISLIIFLPLGFPISIKALILPKGYQYICISLISSIFYLVKYLSENKKVSNFKLVLNTFIASIAPITYLSGPSATYKEINFETRKLFLSGINFFKKLKIILAISGTFRLSLGFLLSSLNSKDIINQFYSDNFFSQYFLLNFILFGFFNFWKYYLLFSGASELCKATLSIFGIEIIDNFKDPEISTSYHDIWNRWHLNITERVRNFIYTPLTLFALRRFSNFNKTLNFILIESLPIFSLFLILSIWHGAKPTDFLYGLISSILTLLSKNFIKINKFQDFLSKNKIFLEIFRFLSISLFGIVLIIYDLGDKNFIEKINFDYSYKQFIPYWIFSIAAYFYFRYKIYFLSIEKEAKSIFRIRRFSLIYFEGVVSILLNIFIIPAFRSDTNFIYFAN